MGTYFAVNLDSRIIENEEGDSFTAGQFKKVIERNAEKGKFFDMTLATQRFIRCGYDFDKIEAEYAEMDANR